MLCFAAIVPSSPLILRAHEDERTKLLWSQTLKGLEMLAQQAKTAELDYGVLISQFLVRDEIFGINVMPRIQCDLRDYGDFNEHAYTGSPRAAHELLIACASIAAASSEKNLSGAHAIALTLLSALPSTGIVPVYLKRDAPPQECARFGRRLSEEILQSPKRYGIIALGDCTPQETAAPVQDRKDAERASQFEQEVIAALKRKAVSKLIDYSTKHANEWQRSALPGLLTLTAIMAEISCQCKALAYEHPFGAAYLTAQYVV